MSKITVYRKPAFCGAPFLLKVFIDGKMRGSIENAETLVLELKPGKYKIQARLFWDHSPEIEFEIAEGQLIELISYPVRIVQFFTFGLCNGLCLKQRVREEELEPVFEYVPLDELHEESYMDGQELEQGYDENGDAIPKNVSEDIPGVD